MTDLDPQSGRLYADIRSRIDRFAKIAPEGCTTADYYTKLLVEHRPQGGRWGSPCLGEHANSTAWPCKEIRRLDQADTYPTNIRVAARWLDVVQGMRAMIAATIPEAIDNIEHQLRIGGPNAAYNRRFAFSAFTMPFTYAIAATPPRKGSEVASVVAPLNDAVQNLLTDQDVRAAAARLEQSMTDAELSLRALVEDPEPASLDELVEELKRTVKVSMLAALVGAAGAVELAEGELSARFEELKYPPAQSRWVELAREPIVMVSRPTETTVSIEEIYQAAAPAVQGMFHPPSPARQTEVQRIQGSQWISYIFAEWNDHYRSELAKVWNCSNRDYVFPFFGELAKVRNDFIHNGGVAKRATASCKILSWFEEDQQMFLSPSMYVDVVTNWPWQELLVKPTPSQELRSQYPGRAPLTLLEEVQRTAAIDGVKPDVVIEAALRLWLQSNG